MRERRSGTAERMTVTARTAKGAASIERLRAVTDTADRSGREDLRGGGDSFFPFLSEEKSGSESVMESRHVSVVHTPAEPEAFPVTPSTNPPPQPRVPLCLPYRHSDPASASSSRSPAS
jgi:hypothetical protein